MLCTEMRQMFTIMQRMYLEDLEKQQAIGEIQRYFEKLIEEVDNKPLQVQNNVYGYGNPYQTPN